MPPRKNRSNPDPIVRTPSVCQGCGKEPVKWHRVSRFNLELGLSCFNAYLADETDKWDSSRRELAKLKGLNLPDASKSFLTRILAGERLNFQAIARAEKAEHSQRYREIERLKELQKARKAKEQAAAV